MSPSQSKDDAGISVVVQRILDDRLEVKLPDETTGCVPIEEAFAGDPDGKSMVLPPNLAYRHPVAIVVGQRLKVLPLAGRSGCYSRKRKVIQAAKALVERSVIPASIT